MSKKPIDPSDAASTLARKRWDKPGADRDQPREAGKLGGRPKLPRCACGAMTVQAAEKIGHRCETGRQG